MDIGMFWMIPDRKKPLVESIIQALEHYERKTGTRATLVFLHPKMPDIPGNKVNGAQLVRSKTVLMQHLWIGHE